MNALAGAGFSQPLTFLTIVAQFAVSSIRNRDICHLFDRSVGSGSSFSYRHQHGYRLIYQKPRRCYWYRGGQYHRQFSGRQKAPSLHRCCHSSPGSEARYAPDCHWCSFRQRAINHRHRGRQDTWRHPKNSCSGTRRRSESLCRFV